MSFEPRDYLRHILVEADYLIDRSKGLSFETFVADQTLRRAFIRSLEIIGEATKKIPEDFRATHPTVEWRAMAGMRDRVGANLSQIQKRTDACLPFARPIAEGGDRTA